MIKKLLILSAILLSCAGCQSLRQASDIEFYQIPFMKIYPWHTREFTWEDESLFSGKNLKLLMMKLSRTWKEYSQKILSVKLILS